VKIEDATYVGNVEMTGPEYVLIPKLYNDPKIDIELVSTPENREVQPIKIANLQNVLWKIKNRYGTNLYRYSKYNGIAELHRDGYKEFEQLLRDKLEKNLEVVRKNTAELNEELSGNLDRVKENGKSHSRKSQQYTKIFKIVKNM